MRRPVILICGLLGTLACGRDPQQRRALIHTSSGGSPEAWDEANDPAHFDEDTLEYRFESLPRDGEVKKIPWVGSYWATALDSINYRWDGDASESVSVKYGRAFGVDGLEARVSEAYGIKSIIEGKACTSDDSCGADEKCATVADASDGGRCIPMWFGLCHGWAAASILIPEPKHAVTVRGVEFKVNDIKALLTIVHDKTPSLQVSLRCDDDEKVIETDSTGRPTDAYRACRDSNAGAYHVLLANFLGKRQESFVEDNTWDAPVWNYPLRSFEIVESEDVSADEANRLLDVSGTRYRYNAEAAKLTYVKTNVYYIGEDMPRRHEPHPSADANTYVDTYEYILEMDGDGKIVGGEWVGDSMQAHPDFLWLPSKEEPGSTNDGVMSYKEVMEIAHAAQS